MIRNDSEYKEALRRIGSEKQSLFDHEAKLRDLGLTPEQVARGMTPLRALHRQFVEDVEEYADAKKGELGESRELRELGRILILARIASGLSQRALAEKINVDESQISRDERNEYNNITLERALAILDAIGIETHLKCEVRHPVANNDKGLQMEYDAHHGKPMKFEDEVPGRPSTSDVEVQVNGRMMANPKQKSSRKAVAAKTPKIDADPSFDLVAPLAERVSIEGVLLVQCRIVFSPEFEKKAEALLLKLKIGFGEMSHEVDRDQDKFSIKIPFSLKAVPSDPVPNESSEADSIFQIQASFILRYGAKSIAEFDDAVFEAFAKTNGVFNAWPYWREFVQSMTMRMGIPGVTIPVFRFPQE